MYGRVTLAALVAAAVLIPLNEASAQALVQGGGASMPASLYHGGADSILPPQFSYVVTGSGTGKRAFLNNDASLFFGAGTVHFAASDSVLSNSELVDYQQNHNQFGDPNRYGPLIQVPVALVPVVVPFNKPGTPLDLNVRQICGVFSGKITRWEELESSGRAGSITVVYRPDSSGSSEILTRFLTAACQPGDVAGTALKAGAGGGGLPGFTVQSSFQNLFVGNSVPPNFFAAPSVGDVALYNMVMAGDGRIGYVGPDVIANLSDATKVATVKGYDPTAVSAQATIETIAPPVGAAAENPANWVPVFANPSVGYPIVGLTNLVFGQCYKNTIAAANLRRFLLTHYGSDQVSGPGQGRNDLAVLNHGFYPLPRMWRDAIRTRFAVPVSTSGLNHPGVCNAIGRP
ncbi:substrate-binding domain-containing protein [Stenotrophomonas maltophilia]|uniref:substrate-binding domain-containing protein n=1 Tax=Stenotrophomonas maltophilia TaxID=40324 RepID=UPI00066A5637